jgi:hypothetical protein
VRVDHRRGYVAVPEEFLDRADVVAGFEEMRGKTVAKRVAGGGLGQARCADRVAEGSLKDSFMEVVAAALARGWVKIGSCCRKDPLPSPFA